jgi:hypothetical protein
MSVAAIRRKTAIRLRLTVPNNSTSISLTLSYLPGNPAAALCTFSTGRSASLKHFVAPHTCLAPTLSAVGRRP